MVKLTVFFTVIYCSLLLDRVDSSHNVNIQNFLEALQQQLKQEQSLQRKEKKQVYYAKEQDNDESYYGSLKKKDVDRIISLAPKLQLKQRSSKNLQRKKQNGQFYIIKRPHSHDVKLVSSNLLRSETEDDSTSTTAEIWDQTRNNEFSKVYVVLNSDAIKRSRNKDKLNALLSSLLTPPQQTQDRIGEYYDERSHHHQHDQYHDKHERYHDHRDRYQDKRQRYRDRNDRYQQHDRYQNKRDRYQYDSERNQDENDRYQDQDRTYKGFRINHNWLRRKMPRGSNEIFANEERMDSRPKPSPLRQRESPREKPRRLRDRGGGGGGGGTHTAIPYIRQRGDIYERDD